MSATLTELGYFEDLVSHYLIEGKFLVAVQEERESGRSLLNFWRSSNFAAKAKENTRKTWNVLRGFEMN